MDPGCAARGWFTSSNWLNTCRLFHLLQTSAHCIDIKEGAVCFMFLIARRFNYMHEELFERIMMKSVVIVEL